MFQQPPTDLLLTVSSCSLLAPLSLTTTVFSPPTDKLQTIVTKRRLSLSTVTTSSPHRCWSTPRLVIFTLVGYRFFHIMFRNCFVLERNSSPFLFLWKHSIVQHLFSSSTYLKSRCFIYHEFVKGFSDTNYLHQSLKSTTWDLYQLSNFLAKFTISNPLIVHKKILENTNRTRIIILLY